MLGLWVALWWHRAVGHQARLCHVCAAEANASCSLLCNFRAVLTTEVSILQQIKQLYFESYAKITCEIPARPARARNSAELQGGVSTLGGFSALDDTWALM